MVHFSIAGWQWALIWASAMVVVPLAAYKMTFGVARSLRRHRSPAFLGIASSTMLYEERGILAIEIINGECIWLSLLSNEAAVLAMFLGAPIGVSFALLGLGVLGLLAFPASMIAELVVLTGRHRRQGA